MVKNNKKSIKRKSKNIIKQIFGDVIINTGKYMLDKKEMIEVLSKGTGNKQLQYPKKVAIIFIGTNNYVYFFPQYYETIKKYFLTETKKDFFVYTDKVDYPYLKLKDDVRIIKIKHKKFPYINLAKFEYIYSAKNELKKYSHIVYIDADMYANDLVTEKEFFSHNKPLFSVNHHCFVRESSRKQWEKNPKSLAFLDHIFHYHQASFFGGKTKPFLNMVKELKKRTEIDLKNKIIAKWWDESYLNRYLVERNKDVYSYPPSYSYSRTKPIPKPFKKKFIHVSDQNPIGFKEKNLIKKEIKKGWV